MEEKSPIEEAKGIAWLSYLGILIILPILLQKDNPFTKFHIKQGLVLLVATVIWSIAGFILSLIPVLGFLIYFIGWLFLLALSIVGIVNAIQGKEKELPFLGKYAEKINF